VAGGLANYVHATEMTPHSSYNCQYMAADYRVTAVDWRLMLVL